MAGLKFIDELIPNGTTFPIADANNVRGGLHYADTIEEMNAMHESRLANGIICHVKEVDAYYTYDFELKKWVISDFSKEDFFTCTQSAVKDSDLSTENKIGNLPRMTKADLEKLTINEILTRALFKEEVPFFTYTAPTINALTQEVGTAVDGSQFIIKPGSYAYGYLNGEIKTGTIVDSGESRSMQYPTAHFGKNTYCSLVAYTDPKITIKGTELKTSWDRTYAEYAADNNTTIALINIKNDYLLSGDVTGYYVIQYAILTTGQMMTLQDDVISGITNLKLSLPAEPNTGRITTTSTEIYIGTKNNTTGLPSSAFIYVAVPQGFKLSSVSMLNGLNFKYEVVPTTRYDKLATAIPALASFCTQSKRDSAGNELYKYDIWYIAKGDANGAGEVSPTTAPMMIKLATA